MAQMNNALLQSLPGKQASYFNYQKYQIINLPQSTKNKNKMKKMLFFFK